MTVFDNYFPLGLGTSRFLTVGEAEFEKSVQLVVKAFESGINYVDTADIYSGRMAHSILKKAFQLSRKKVDVTIKSQYMYDKTSDQALATAERSLKNMDIQHAAFFVCWNITSYEQFQKIMQKGSIYDAALKLKREGTIKHICASIHVPFSDIIKIIESQAFEGITISYNLLNANSMQPVLDCAIKHDIGIAVMNPFAGGLIPQNEEYFSYVTHCKDTHVTHATLRFINAHPAVKIILSGISNEMELNENLLAFTKKNYEADKKRLKRTIDASKIIENYCTGCGYCVNCPQNIPVPEIMGNRNKLIFKSRETYNRTEPELVKNINLFYRCDYMPEVFDNLCIKCGICEKMCTQKLPVIRGVKDFYERAQKCGYSLTARKARIKDFFANEKYKRVGLFPNGGFADLVINLYNEIFDKRDVKWFFFNNNSKMHGKIVNDIVIYSPDEISKLGLDIIIVCTYKYENEIYYQLLEYEHYGIKIVKLHSENDVPWVW